MKFLPLLSLIVFLSSWISIPGTLRLRSWARSFTEKTSVNWLRWQQKIRLYSSVVVLVILILECGVGYSQTPSNPIIRDFGIVNAIPDVTPTNTDLIYKIVIDLKSSNDNYKSLNKGLNNVARMLNLHGTAGIPKENLHVAVAIHYTATPIILSNDGYLKKYGVDNPNLKLIDQLKEAGVELYVCGQSLVARKYDFEAVNPKVDIGLSMLTVVSEKMMKGYQLLVFE